MTTTGHCWVLGAAGGQKGKISEMESATEGYMNAGNLSRSNEPIMHQQWGLEDANEWPHPWSNSRTCRGGGEGEKAKIKLAMVIEVIRINLNQSNKIFTYKKWYLKNVHKWCQPLQVVGAAKGQKWENAKTKSATEGQVNADSFPFTRENRKEYYNVIWSYSRQQNLSNVCTLCKDALISQQMIVLKSCKY